MSWFKVDDKFHAHPKVKRIPKRLRRAAVGLWTLTGAWSADYETDGEVPEYMLDEFDAEPEEVDALVAAGLWERVEDGIRFRSWEEFQPTRAEQDAKRAATAERVRKYRQGKRNSTDRPVTSGKSNAVTGALVTDVYSPPEPEPEPEPTNTPLPPEGELLAAPEPSPRKRTAFVYPDAFERFWTAWPKPGDTKRTAHTAWEKATKGTSRRPARVDAATVQAAVEAYAADPNLPEPQYIPAASTWLNQDRWENGPLPPRAGSRSRPEAGDTHRAMHQSRTAAEAYAALEADGYYDTTPAPLHLTRRPA